MKPSFLATRRKSSAFALGINDFGSVSGQWLLSPGIFFGDYVEYGCQFCQRLLSSRHERMATGYGRHFRYPTIRLVSVEHHLVVVQAHAIIVSRLGDSGAFQAISSSPRIELINRATCFDVRQQIR